MTKQYNIVSELVEKHVMAGLGQQLAIIDANNSSSITYQELYVKIQNLNFPGLKTLNPGDVVTCMLEDSIDHVIFFLGLIWRGIIPCLINPAATKDTLKWQLQTINSKYLITSKQNNGNIDFISEERCYFFDCHNENDKPVSQTLNLGDSERPAFCLFSSGTTGQPNAVMHRHKDIEVMNRNYGNQILSLQSHDVIFSTSKLFFAYGLNSILFALFYGATAVLSPFQADPKLITDICSKYSPTIFFSVPTIYSRLLKHNIPKEALKKARLFISAGERLPIKINEDWNQKFNSYIIDGIGTTEIMSTFISNSPNSIRIGSTGKAVQGFELRILDESGNELDHNQIGILWVKGDTYLDYYANNNEATNERFADGWFKTNDLFLKDIDNYYYYQGRANDLIKSGGIWIYPHRIEEILIQHDAVLECAVAGIEQSNGLIRPHAFIVIKNGFLLTENLKEELKNFCKSRCSKWEYPHFISFLSELPKTATGKIRKFVLKDYQCREPQ